MAEQRLRYPTLEAPLLLITGDADRVVPAWNHADRLVREAPEVELMTWPGAGHALHHTETAVIAARILGFAKGVWGRC